MIKIPTIPRFAIDVLLNYFTYTDLSPMKKTFVNVKEPLATGVGLSQNSNWEQAISAAFKNVPVDRIEEVKPTFDKVLSQIWKGGAKSLDMGRIHTISKLEHYVGKQAWAILKFFGQCQ